MSTHTPSGVLSADPLEIWIIEDNRAFAQSVVDLINRTEGMKCPQKFPSCEQALDALRENSPPEVVLLDLGLPGMNGIEGVSQIKSLSPRSLVIILTVHDDDASVFKALCAGADGYLLKDTFADSLADAIHELRVGGAPMSPQIARKVMDIFARMHSPHDSYQLTDREEEILRLLVDGLSKQQIANKVFLSFHTVDFHLRNIYAKLHVNSRSRAISKSLRERIV